MSATWRRRRSPAPALAPQLLVGRMLGGAECTWNLAWALQGVEAVRTTRAAASSCGQHSCRLGTPASDAGRLVGGICQFFHQEFLPSARPRSGHERQAPLVPPVSSTTGGCGSLPQPWLLAMGARAAALGHDATRCVTIVIDHQTIPLLLPCLCGALLSASGRACTLRTACAGAQTNHTRLPPPLHTCSGMVAHPPRPAFCGSPCTGSDCAAQCRGRTRPPHPRGLHAACQENVEHALVLAAMRRAVIVAKRMPSSHPRLRRRRSRCIP